MTHPLNLKIALAVAVFAVATALPASAHAETLYTKTDDTKVLASESSDAKVVKTLPQNTPVDVLQKSAKFFKVAIPGGGEGWIFKFKLGPAPADEGSSGGDLLGGLGGKQKFAANESASGASIRGLSPVAERHAQQKGISPGVVEAVKNMEQYRIDPKELDAFLREGRLGEYSQ
jgi:hypothetical protein